MNASEAIFRGYCEYRKEWIEGQYVVVPLTDESAASSEARGLYFLAGMEQTPCIIRNSCSYRINPDTLSRWTGFIDRAGAKVFEGDKCDGHSDGEGIIVWSSFDGGWDYAFGVGSLVGIWEVKDDLVVVGNIWGL